MVCDRDRFTRLNSRRQTEVGNVRREKRTSNSQKCREQTLVGMLVTTPARIKGTRPY